MTASDFLATVNWIVLIKFALGAMIVGSLWGACVGAREGIIEGVSFAGFGMLIGLSAALIVAVFSLGLIFIIFV